MTDLESSARGLSDGARPDDGKTVLELHEPIYREMAEPRDGYEPPPTWLVFLCLAIMGFGGWYLGMYSGSFSPDVYNETGGPVGGLRVEVESGAAVDPMVLGKRIYNNCMACHQRDGLGVPGNYPPLTGSEWVHGAPGLLAALVLHGLEGVVEVKGETYNQVMPKWSHLTDDQVAAVLTFIRGSWDNAAGPVSPELVAAVRAQTSGRARPWTAPELEEFATSFAAPAVEPTAETEVES